jgi:hypothetical protein
LFPFLDRYSPDHRQFEPVVVECPSPGAPFLARPLREKWGCSTAPRPEAGSVLTLLGHYPEAGSSTFPQPSTGASCDEQPLLRNQKSAELENVRKASSHQCHPASAVQASKPEAKSLLRNTLPATLFASRFCPDHPRTKTNKSFRTRILTTRSKKMYGISSPRCHRHKPTRKQGDSSLRKPKAEGRTRGVK